MGKKANQIEIAERQDKIQQLLVEGASAGQIVRFVSEKTDWSIGRRQVENYIAQVYRGFAEIADKDRPEQFQKAVQRLTLLFARSLKIQDYKTCLAIQKELNELYGLHAPRQMSAQIDIHSTSVSVRKWEIVPASQLKVERSKSA